MDLENSYLNTLLDQPEYVCIKLVDIPLEFIDKYKLNKITCNFLIYFEMHRGMYGLPHPKQASLPTKSSETTSPILTTTKQPPHT